MKVVIDTNVFVSALLREGTPPAAVLDAFLHGDLSLLYDRRILDEYREVLVRPTFGFDPKKVEVVLAFVASAGLFVADAVFPRALPDPDDQPFADVAFSGGADALITGNKAHFPVEDAIRVMTPREWLNTRSARGR